jgi:hypothetical protein
MLTFLKMAPQKPKTRGGVLQLTDVLRVFALHNYAKLEEVSTRS